MDPKINLNLKSEERLECLRRPLRRHLTTDESLSSKSDHFLGPFLENFCFFSTQIREKHFFDGLTIGDQLLAKIAAKTDSLVLKVIRSKTRFVSDLSLSQWSVVMTTKEDVEVNDVVVVTVVKIIRHQKRVFCQFKDTTDVDDWTTPPNNSFEAYIRSQNDFRNPFVLKKKSFSTLLFDKCFEEKKEKKRKRRDSSSSSSSSSSSNSSSSSSSSSSSEEKRKKEKKISFVVKKSSKVSSKMSSIPGFERNETTVATISDRMRRKLKKESEIERKLMKNIQKF